MAAITPVKTNTASDASTSFDYAGQSVSTTPMTAKQQQNLIASNSMKMQISDSGSDTDANGNGIPDSQESAASLAGGGAAASAAGASASAETGSVGNTGTVRAAGLESMSTDSFSQPREKKLSYRATTTA